MLLATQPSRNRILADDPRVLVLRSAVLCLGALVFSAELLVTAVLSPVNMWLLFAAVVLAMVALQVRPARGGAGAPPLVRYMEHLGITTVAAYGFIALLTVVQTSGVLILPLLGGLIAFAVGDAFLVLLARSVAEREPVRDLLRRRAA
jgi:hypothetical protein